MAILPFSSKRVVTTGLQIAAAIVPIPQASTVLKVLADITEACGGVKSQGASQLGERVKILTAVFVKHQEELSKTTMATSVDDIIGKLDGIRSKVETWAAYSWFQSTLRAREISDGLRNCSAQIDMLLGNFELAAKFQTGAEYLLRDPATLSSLLREANAMSYRNDSELALNGQKMNRTALESVYLRLQDELRMHEARVGIKPFSNDLSSQVSIGTESRCIRSEMHAMVVTGIYLRTIEVAVKKLRYVKTNSEKNIKRFFNEWKVWSTVGKHPHILPLLGFMTRGEVLGLVYPLMSNGSLVQHCHNYKRADRLHLLVGAANGLAYLHGIRAVHGSMKAANIAVNDENEAVLFDFEMSRIIMEIEREAKHMDTLTRSPSYRWAAPELARGANVDSRADVWSFGMVMVEVFTLKPPFHEIAREATVHYEVSRGYRPSRPTSEWVTDELWDLMQDCWKEPQQRPTMEEVEMRLREAEQYRQDNPFPPPPPPPPRRDSDFSFMFEAPDDI